MFPRRLCLVVSLLAATVALHGKAPNDPTKWEKEIAAFEAVDRDRAPQKGGILFIGSSSIRMWKTLAHDFPGLPVLNRGFGGSQIEDSTFYIERIVIPYAPRQIVMYAGGNDINFGKEPNDIIADFQKFTAKVRTALPEVEIDYISVAGNPSRWAQVEKVRAVNAGIAAWIKEQPRMKFIDVFPHMLGPDGLPKPDIFLDDRLHMNAAGYAIWKEVVGPFLQK